MGLRAMSMRGWGVDGGVLWRLKTQLSQQTLENPIRESVRKEKDESK